MLIFLNGSDDYQAKQTIKQLVAKYISKNPDGSELIRTDVTDDNFQVNWQRIVSDLKAIPLFASSRLVIIERIGRLPVAAQDDLAQNLTFLPETTVVVLWDDLALKSQTLKAVLASAKLINVVPLTATTLLRWLKDKAKLSDLELDNTELKVLMDEFGSNLWALETEITMLANASKDTTNPSANGFKRVTDAPFAIFNYVRSQDWPKAGQQLISDIKEGKPFELILGGLAAAVRKEVRNHSLRSRLTSLMVDLDFAVKTGQLEDGIAVALLASYLPNSDLKRVRWEATWREV